MRRAPKMPYGVVSPVSSVSFIQSLPADKHALHDIRFRFKVDNIWTTITTNHPELESNAKSKNISLEPLDNFVGSVNRI
jgi:hypothetical protein